MANNIKVVKFGGSSLADAGQFAKVLEIIRADESRRYVVPSAPGKRFAGDRKVTDLLYGCYDLASDGESIDKEFEEIANRYRDIINGLGLNLSLEDEFERIKQAFIHHAGRDYAASRGEYLCGLILAAALGYDFVDPATVIFFGDNGVFDGERTNVVLRCLMADHERAVVPGFYGSMPNDTIKTFSRGGSDITGAIVARAVNADVYENWTDVSGFLMADPRIVENPKRIDRITYRELRELSYMGATVLHEDSVLPVRIAGIPINIRNTNDPSAPGTMIVADDSHDCDKIITGIAGKRGFSVITIEKDLMNSELGFGRRVLEVLEKQGISFEHLPSGIDTMSVIIASSTLEGRREKIIDEICAICRPDNIAIESGIALIAVVGHGMVSTKGTAARVFGAISKADINIRMIDQGSCELNIIIGVNENDFEGTIRAIYNEFV